MISTPNKTGLRQAFSIVLIIAGALIMLLASESWTGLLFMGLGMLIETLAISINHYD